MKLQNFKKSDTLVTLYVDSEGANNVKQLQNCIFSLAKQTKKVDLLVLYNDLNEGELKNLQESLSSPSFTYMSKDEEGKLVENKLGLEKEESINYVIEKTSANTFSKIFNQGFNASEQNEYTYYSIIEQEDTISHSWYKTSDIYFSEDNKLSIALPLMRNTINGSFAGVLNEAPWVEGLSEEAGITDINLLLRFNIINPLGMVCKVSDLKENSEQKEDGLYYPIKESVKFTNYYEFFLRMIYNDLRIKTIPRIGYELNMISKNGYKESTSKIPNNISTLPKEAGGATQQEVQFYVELAKKEYFFDKDRNVTFNN